MSCGTYCTIGRNLGAEGQEILLHISCETEKCEFQMFVYSLLHSSHRGDSLVIVPWRERKHRAQDWCEEAECRLVACSLSICPLRDGEKGTQ